MGDGEGRGPFQAVVDKNVPGEVVLYRVLQVFDEGCSQIRERVLDPCIREKVFHGILVSQLGWGQQAHDKEVSGEGFILGQLLPQRGHPAPGGVDVGHAVPPEHNEIVVAQQLSVANLRGIPMALGELDEEVVQPSQETAVLDDLFREGPELQDDGPQFGAQLLHDFHELAGEQVAVEKVGIVLPLSRAVPWVSWIGMDGDLLGGLQAEPEVVGGEGVETRYQPLTGELVEGAIDPDGGKITGVFGQTALLKCFFTGIVVVVHQPLPTLVLPR